MQNKTWLAAVQESILDPDRPICDPHHHLWDHPGNRYLLPELLADIGSGHNVVSTVFVECSSMYRAAGPAALAPVGETEFVNGIAAMSASGQYGPARVCAGIVGFADLSLGSAVGPVLDAHIKASPRFRGIRHAVSWDSSDDVRNSHTDSTPYLLADPDFLAGSEALQHRGLSFEAWLYHHQIPELTEFAKQLPDLPIIFDHFGGPLGIGPYSGQGDAVFAQWSKAVAELARCDNVYAKLGGLAMPINGHGWHKRDTPATSDELVAAVRRYYDRAIELFTPQRCMFESNFPVDRQSISYSVLWNAHKKIAAGRSAADQDALFHDTAVKVYRLNA